MLVSDGMTCTWERSGVRRCGGGSDVVGKICGGATLRDDAVSGGMKCAWDQIGVCWCGAGSDVAGIKCGGANRGADAGVCVAAAGRRHAEGARCTGARRTLGDGARGAGETSGTAGGDRGPAAELNIVAIWRMARRWSWPRVAKGAAGDRLARASIKSLAARWASSTEDVWGMAQLLGKIQWYWRCICRPWTVCRRGSSNSDQGLRQFTSRRRHEWPKCGGRPGFHGLGGAYRVVQGEID